MSTIAPDVRSEAPSPSDRGMVVHVKTMPEIVVPPPPPPVTDTPMLMFYGMGV